MKMIKVLIGTIMIMIIMWMIGLDPQHIHVVGVICLFGFGISIEIFEIKQHLEKYYDN